MKNNYFLNALWMFHLWFFDLHFHLSFCECKNKFKHCKLCLNEWESKSKGIYLLKRKHSMNRRDFLVLWYHYYYKANRLSKWVIHSERENNSTLDSPETVFLSTRCCKLRARKQRRSSTNCRWGFLPNIVVFGNQFTRWTWRSVTTGWVVLWYHQ